jgi:arginase
MIKVLGIPFDSNSSFLRGPYLAPSRIRLMASEGSANNYTEEGVEIIAGRDYQDLGDISFSQANIPKRPTSRSKQLSLRPSRMAANS